MTTPYLRNYYAGGGTSTTLANAMGEYDDSFVITADTGWPGGAGFFTVVVDRGTSSEEKIRCASNSGTTVTVASDGNGGRGYDGTSATSHNAGATVSLCGTAVDFDQANQAVTQVFGQSGAAKGDILAMLSAAGPNTLTRVGIGTTGQLLGVASGLPAWQYPALTSYADYLTTSSLALTTLNTGYNVASQSLAAGTWVLNAFALAYNSSSSSVDVEIALTPTSVSFTSAYAGTQMTFPATSAVYGVLAVGCTITLATTTTVYLVALASVSSAAYIEYKTAQSVPNASGFTAVRIA